ncbi:MAG: rane protein [Herminiimonas sp.]|nr:rane protein [Herminiimonas sp.]
MKIMSHPARVFALFACGYFVSYAYRGINIGFAPYLISELGISATDLGLLTSLYFLGFAGAQVPAGILLDRYGSRRVCALLMLVAAAGSLIFALAQSKEGLMTGRLLVGLGLSVCLGGAYKALAQWYEVKRLPLVNGLTVAVGGMAGVAMGSPMLWLLSAVDWRTVCFGLTVLTVVVAAAIWFGVPRHKEVPHEVDFASQLRGVWQVWCSPVFWKLGAFSSITQAVFFALQTLWVAPFLRDVNGAPPAEVGLVVSVLAVAMVAGSLGFGLAARAVERLGVSVRMFCGCGMILFMLVQLAIVARVPLPLWLLWSGYGFFGSSGLLGYAILAGKFPPHLLGRVNTSYTLLIFLLIFGCQVGIGAVLNQWPAQQGQFPVPAHLTAWAVLIGLQLMTAVFYFLPQRSGSS